MYFSKSSLFIESLSSNNILSDFSLAPSSTIHTLVCFFSFIILIRSSADIRRKCYKSTTNNRTKKNIIIYENRMSSVIKVSIELTTNGKKKKRIKV